MSLNPLSSYQPLDALADWLANEPLQPGFVRGVLGVTHAKAQFRRFETDFQHSAFSDERRREIRDDEYADQLRDEDRERAERDE